MAGGGAVAAVVAAGDLDDDTFGQLPPSRRESSMMMVSLGWVWVRRFFQCSYCVNARYSVLLYGYKGPLGS